MPNITTALTPETLEEGLREVFTDSYKMETEAMQARTSDLFKFYGSKKHNEDFEKVSGVGRFTSVAEEDPTPIVKRNELFKTTFVHSTFRKGVGVTYEELEDQLYAGMKDHTEQLGIAARETQEFNRMAVYRNITTTTGGDGKALAANDHETRSSTVDNLLTGEITVPKLKEMINFLRLQVDYEDKKIGGKPKVFVCSAANHDQVLELTKSKLRAGTGNNDLNYFSEVFPGVKVEWNLHYGADEGGSDTSVTLLSTRHRLISVLREKLNNWMNPWKDAEDIVTKFNAKYRESVGFSDFVGVVHCTGV